MDSATIISRLAIAGQVDGMPHVVVKGNGATTPSQAKAHMR